MVQLYILYSVKEDKCFLSYHSVNQSCIFFLLLANSLYWVLNELLFYLTSTVHISGSKNALFLLVLHAFFVLLLKLHELLSLFLHNKE